MLLRAQPLDISIFNLLPNMKYDTFISHTKSSYDGKPVSHVTPDTSVSVCQNNNELWFDCNTATTSNYSRSVVAVVVWPPFEKSDINWVFLHILNILLSIILYYGIVSKFFGRFVCILLKNMAKKTDKKWQELGNMRSLTPIYRMASDYPSTLIFKRL